MKTETKNNRQKSRLEEFLSLFTEVRKGEGLKALLLGVNIFLILTAYYIIKPVREALILAGGTGELSGAVLKSIAATGQVILLIFAIPLYSRIASRVSRRKLINLVTLFFAGCLAIFFVLAKSHFPLGIIFFLWVGIFNLMVPAQFWAFANDLYSPEAGKRIFVLIAFGASSGAVLGGILADLFIEIIGVYQLLLLAGLILLSSLIITNIVESWSRNKKFASENGTEEKPSYEEPLKKDGAFRLVFQKKYLLMIALLMTLLNWVNTNGEYILGQTVENVAKSSVEDPLVIEQADRYAREQLIFNQNKNQPDPDQSVDETRARSDDKLLEEYRQQFEQEYIEEYIGNFYAGFFTAVNILGLMLQLFIVSRIIKYLGIRVAILILPIISFIGYFTIAFIPLLTIIRWVKIAENATDYSLQNTVRQVLFLPTTREDKYKAKQAIDTFFWRAGDVLSTLVVFVGSTLLFFSVKHFALVNMGLVGFWLLLAYLIGKENTRLTQPQNTSR